jgi:hypothetical protein
LGFPNLLGSARADKGVPQGLWAVVVAGEPIWSQPNRAECVIQQTHSFLKSKKRAQNKLPWAQVASGSSQEMDT